MAEPGRALLTVRDLTKHFPIRRGFLSRVVGHVRAVDGVSFEVRRGECLGLVGESGSGKTTVGRCILRAIRPTAGEIELRLADEVVRLDQAAPEDLRRLRRHTQMVFQDPYSSLNPRMTVLDIVGEPLTAQRVGTRREREDRVRELLTQVGLKQDYLRRYPHAFSGGQRQRIGIARALALEPEFIVADEPVSALDVSVQAQVLNLLQGLQRQLGLTYLFIAHDLSVVRHISDRVAVMYVGRLVELATVEALFGCPLHPYTHALLAAVPVPDPEKRGRRVVARGEVADPAAPPEGCHFHPRCPRAEARCRTEPPELLEVAPDHFVRCHFP